MIAVLRPCPYLEKLHVVSDGSIPRPPPMMTLDVVSDTHMGSRRGSRRETNGNWKSRTNGNARGPQVGAFRMNLSITQIYVGHSPIVEDRERLKDVESCLRSMAGGFRSRKEHIDMVDMPDMAEGWRSMQPMMVENDVTRKSRLRATGGTIADDTRPARGRRRTGLEETGIELKHEKCNGKLTRTS